MTDKNTEEFCDHCGSPLKSYWHSLTPGLVNTLMVFAQGIKRKRVNLVHLARDLKLTHNQHANFQKLRYFGLVAHGDRSNPKSGTWVLTKLALDFLHNQTAVPKKIRTFRNIVEEKSNEMVLFKDFTKKSPTATQDFWQKEFEWEIVDHHVILPGQKEMPAQSTSLFPPNI